MFDLFEITVSYDVEKNPKLNKQDLLLDFIKKQSKMDNCKTLVGVSEISQNDFKNYQFKGKNKP